MLDQMWQHSARHQKSQTKAKLLPWKCHYYEKLGQIKPFCCRLYAYPKHPNQLRGNHVMSKARKDWKLRGVNTSLIDHISLRSPSREG